MFIALLTLLSALSVSGVAIFYSVIGLATIFPGAFVPVIIMGSVLEVGKLVTASWLYRHWKQTRFILKTYLTVAVVVLSLITSMGIFGFLSKAHLEQNLQSQNLTQRIEIINNKIQSQGTYINRQTLIIERAEKSLSVTVSTNDVAIDIEKESLKSVEDKFKTLLVVETNTIENLSSRLKILDKDVSDVLTTNKSFFNEEKAAATLKESQKEERALINKEISEAQDRIAILKDDYTVDTTVIQKRIDKLREGDVDDKSEVHARIEIAEKNIVNAQNNIDDLIVDREPLESDMIKLEAEVGPIKYIAALVVDWGVTTDVDLNEAVRWVILIIICVFDPLAVALLIAANQSFLRRFPVEPPLPPQEIVDLEKPEPYEPPVETEPGPVIKAIKEQTEKIQSDWNNKLQAFNKKVPKPEDKPVEFIKDDSQKKTNTEEIIAYKEKQAKEEEFERRIQAEHQALEEYSRKAREEDKEPSVSELLAEGMKKQIEDEEKEEAEEEAKEEGIPVWEGDIKPEPTISEKIEKVMEPERTRPDFTEVINPEVAVKEMMTVPTKVIKDLVKVQSGLGLKRGAFGTVVVDKKKVVKEIRPKITAVEQTALPTMTPAELQEEFDIKPNYVQNEEQDDTTIWNKIKYTKYKNRLATDDEYRLRIEKRIDELMGQLERNEIKLEDLTDEDQKVIMDILNQNA